MPCDTILKERQTQAQRAREIKEALARLEQQLQSGKTQVKIGPTGAIAFVGWNDRDSVTDVCAYRTLTMQNSWALKQAVARAEALSGKKVNPMSVASGMHSHDGGHTWGTH